MADWDDYVTALTRVTQLAGDEGRAVAQIESRGADIVAGAEQAAASALATVDRLSRQVSDLKKPMADLLADLSASPGTPTAYEPSLEPLQREARDVDAWLSAAGPRLQSLSRTRARLASRPLPEPLPPPASPVRASRTPVLVGSILAVLVIVAVVIFVLTRT